ncbi:flagellar hook-length control protein FliK [Marinobacter sp. es.048]|uniref:flagellar hook-length control protein FliK n=1 Tax=Marinobacter sp. es.048 TaxID=1761795 RepID=UPI000B58C096|nr:flagellar hook-length control protein FliK [Marinobacter sp. es.048]SNC67197.1 flagellar hook-length control protein FliK [Marinobacter sp. es.048]
MAQMVLPQTPAPGTQKDPGQSKSGTSRDPADRKNDFESVSQAEQKRLDRQKADRNAEARSTDESRSAQDTSSDTKTEANANADGKVGEKADAATDAGPRGVGESAVAGDGDSEPTALPLTFLELQSWLNPQAGRTGETASSTMLPGAGVNAAAGGSGQTNNAVAGLFSGLLSAAPGQTASAASSGVAADNTLTDAMKASVITDTGRNADSGSLISSGRFQSAMDLLSQQASNNANGAAKLVAENAAPLRGYATSIDVPVGHAEWGDKLVGKLSWLTARNMSVAEIHLTPPDMGPMEVKVRVQNEQANITVHSANPVVRDQLELHSHRLRDMLGEQGLSLAGFDVSDSPRQQTGEQGAGDGNGSGADSTSLAAGEQDDESVSSGSLDLSWKGEVDIFA